MSIKNNDLLTNLDILSGERSMGEMEIWKQTYSDCQAANGASITNYKCRQCNKKGLVISLQSDYESGAVICLDCLKKLIKEAKPLIEKLQKKIIKK